MGMARSIPNQILKASTQITKWNQQVEHAGSKKYVKTIEKTNEEYIRYIFRYAQSIKDAKATYQELAEYMNLKSDVEGETRPTLHLSK